MENQFLDEAHESLGIYPQAIKRGGVWEYRTPYQEGWNAAFIALLEHYESMMTWVAMLPIETVAALRELLAGDVLFLRVRKDGTITCLLAMNDTFEYACADAEQVPTEDLCAVAQLWRDYGNAGMAAWAALRRGDEPIRELQTPKYIMARTAILAGK